MISCGVMKTEFSSYIINSETSTVENPLLLTDKFYEFIQLFYVT